MADYPNTRHFTIKLPQGEFAQLACVTNTHSRRLNHQFRGIDKPTNVLSFPQYEPQELAHLLRTRKKYIQKKCGQKKYSQKKHTHPVNQNLRDNQSAGVHTPFYLGDIILADQYVIAEAKRLKRPLDFHLAHLLIHAILHLYGHEHETDRGYALMAALEKKYLKKMGYPDPYLDLSADYARI